MQFDARLDERDAQAPDRLATGAEPDLVGPGGDVVHARLRGADAQRARVVGGPQPERAAGRLLAQVGQRALEDDLPRAHDRHAVAQLLDLPHEVAGEQDRHAAVGQAPHERAHVAHPGGVQAGRRLVEQEQARLADEGAGDAQPLAHAVRVAADLVLGAVAEVDRLERLLDAGPGVAAVEAGEQLEVAPAAQVRIEAGRLDEPRDPLEGAGALAHRVAPEQLGATGRRADQAQEHPQRRGLPGPVGPEVAVDVAGLHRQVDAVDGGEVAVALHQAPGADGRRGLLRARAAGGRRAQKSSRAAASAAAGGTDPITV